MRLGLGTAQFGLDYGATNRRGRVEETVAHRILADAVALGVETLDTAPAYGDAEAVIGRSSERKVLRIVTKTTGRAAGGSRGDVVPYIERGFTRSLARLRLERVYGLLVHDTADLLGAGGDRLAEWLLRQRAIGFAERIGVSVYSPHEARTLFGRYPFDLIQAPLSVLDQRMLATGTFAWLEARAVEVHVRSVLLQGVLVAAPSRPNAMASRLGPALASWRQWIAERGVEPIRAALGFAAAACPSATLLCGVTSADELAGVAAALREPWDGAREFAALASAGDAAVDPRRW